MEGLGLSGGWGCSTVPGAATTAPSGAERVGEACGWATTAAHNSWRVLANFAQVPEVSKRLKLAPDMNVALCSAAVPTSEILARPSVVISTFFDLRSLHGSHDQWQVLVGERALKTRAGRAPQHSACIPTKSSTKQGGTPCCHWCTAVAGVNAHTRTGASRFGYAGTPDPLQCPARFGGRQWTIQGVPRCTARCAGRRPVGGGEEGQCAEFVAICLEIQYAVMHCSRVCQALPEC